MPADTTRSASSTRACPAARRPWAGAGILPPGNRAGANTPEAQLRALSHERWAGLSSELQTETGIDNGYHPCGGICVGLESEQELDAEIAGWHEEGVPVERIPISEAARLEPVLSADMAAAYRLPSLAQVRNPRHLKALLAACQRRGVHVHSATRAANLVVGNGRVIGVRTPSETLPAQAVCVAGGAWSAELLRSVGVAAEITPVRGQIALLSLPSPIFRHVIECGPRYLVPRPDGRVIVGATQEHVGFDKRNTAGGVCGLIDFAVRLIPELADATLERTWAGLRPGTPDGLPYLGTVPEVNGLFVAAGHFRAGLQMSPGTAGVMAALIAGERPPIPVEGFSLQRHSGPAS